MKKLTRLLSVLMLIVMCISLMSVSASAAGVVIGGNTGNGSGAEEPRTVGNGGREVTGTGTYDPSAEEAVDAEDAEEASEEVNEAPKGTETVNVSDYSLDIWSYVDQSYPNVSDNKDQILYVLNGYSAGTIAKNSAEMKDLLALFKEAVQPAITAVDDAKVAVKSKDTNAEVYAQAKSGATEGEAYENYKNEYLANPVEVYLANKDIMPKMMMMSGVAGTSFKATVNEVSYTDLAAAIKAANSGKYEIAVTGTQTYTEGTYSINLGGNTFTISGGNAVFNVTGGTYSFNNGTIEGDGFIVKGSSTRVVINGITVKDAINSAVSIADGATVSIGQDSKCTFKGGSDNTVDFRGSKLTMNADVKTSGGNAVYVQNGELNVNGGEIIGLTGIYMEGGTLNYNNPNGTVEGNGSPTSANKGIGAAIASVSDKAAINIISAADGTVRSSRNGAIVSFTGGSRDYAENSYTGGKIHVANSEWLAGKLYSDYEGAVAAIGNTEYPSVGSAIEAAEDGETVKLLCNLTLNSAITVNKSVIFDGQGYTLSVTDSVANAAINVTKGTVQLKNIEINCNGKPVNALRVNGGNVTVSSFTVHNCPSAGILNQGGTLEVSGYINDSTMTGSTGFAATAGTTKVHSCTVDCPNPIDSSNKTGIAIDGGSFKFSSTTETEKKKLVDSCTIQGATGEQEGNYYVIEQNSASIVMISGYDTSAEDPYFWYFKGLGTDNAEMKFTTDEIVGDRVNATAIKSDGTTCCVFINKVIDEEGVAYYTVDATQVSKLAAGSYTLRIPFTKGNYCDVGLEVYADAKVYCYKSDGSKYWYDDDETIPLYDATQNKAGLLTFTDKPVKVGITYNANDVNTITWLDDIYFNSDGESFTLIQEDLNKLPAGLNYVVLKYDDDCIFGAQIYVKNVDASISPETLKWSTLVGDSTFTVYPDIKTVKFDGKVITKDTDYTINSAGKLILKGSFLKGYMVQGERTEHKLLVETSKGNVVSTITVGEDLKNNGVNYHIYGGTATLSFIGSSSIDFESGIWIGAKNPVQVPTDYIVKTTGTTFTLTAEYLNKLTYGTYTIGAYVDGTYCTTTFLITSADAASYVASTGDTFNAWIWIAILVLVAVIFFVILLPKIRGSRNKENVPEETVPEEDTSKKD